MHILISYEDNPEFSLFKTRLGRDDLKFKSWLGYNRNGDNLPYTNCSGVWHILVGSITKAELSKVCALEPTLKFRVVEDDDFRKAQTFLSTPSLNMHQISAKTLYSIENLDYEVTDLQASLLKGFVGF